MEKSHVGRREFIQAASVGIIGLSATPVSASEDEYTISGQNLTITPADGSASRTDYAGKIQYNNEEYLSNIKGSPRLPTGESFEFESRDELEQLQNNSLLGYRTVDQYAAEGKPLKVTSEVAVDRDENNGLISLSLTNNGGEAIEINTPGSYIGQEIGTATLRLSESKRNNNYRFYVSENTEHQFDDVGRWDTYEISGEIPYVMAFTDEFAFAIGQYEGTTDVQMAMTEYDPPSAIRIFVGSVVLDPGESANWKMGFAGFENEGSVQSEAQQLLEEMEGVDLPSTDEQDEKDDESGIITGTVTNEEDSQLSDVSITLIENDNVVSETTTDEDGEYELTEIATGTYDIEAVKSDYKTGVDEVTVEADLTTELPFELVADIEEETGMITGETVDQDATPLEETAIEVVDGGDIIAETTTDEDGEYELTDVPTGTYEVDAVQSGYEVETDEITVEGDTTHEISFMLVEEDTDDDDMSEGPEEPEEPTARVSVSTVSVTVGQQVRFTADDSEAPTGSIESFRWELGDGQTEAGETVTHRYETAGEYTVELTVVTDQDETDTTRETIVVEETDQDDGETTGDDNSDDPVEVEVPGFGIGSAVASIGGAGYVIKRRLGPDQTDK